MGNFNGGVYRRFCDVPSLYAENIMMDGGAAIERIISNGKSWLLENFEFNQPESYVVLNDLSGDLLLGLSLIKNLLRPDNPDFVSPFLFIETPGGVVKIEPSITGVTFEDGNDCFGSIRALPEGISKSWLWRTGGWKIPKSIPDNPLISRGLVAHPQASWVPVDRIIASYGRDSEKLMAELVRRVPNAVGMRRNVHDGMNYKWVSMRCFLDTRQDGTQGACGDQLFVLDSVRDGAVYHINNGAVDDIRLILNPVEAVDCYSSHVLKGSGGDFDFLPWGRRL